jgi:hypothetical protein
MPKTELCGNVDLYWIYSRFQKAFVHTLKIGPRQLLVLVRTTLVSERMRARWAVAA